VRELYERAVRELYERAVRELRESVRPEILVLQIRIKNVADTDV
jgi:hypothetical protein